MSEAVKTTIPDELGEELQDIAVFDDASAEYLLKRIAEANDQYERMEAWYTFQLSKAKEVRDRTLAWAMSNLRGYMDMVPAKSAKTQSSYELPGGKLVLKKQEPKFEQNDEVLVPWLKQNGMAEMVAVKEEAKWKDLKPKLKVSPDGTAMVTADGEIVPGVTVTPRGDKFTVTQNGKTITYDQTGNTVTVK